MDYEEMVKHVETEHVGDDQELVKASIVIPDNIHMLKMFQCGIKSCGRKLVGLTELDLKEHIRRNHGEFYIHMGQGRNLIRLCRLCPSIKFVSDQSLTEHLQQSHSLALYANIESREILPAVALSRAPVLRDSLSVSYREDLTSVEVEGRRERLDVWYFRDQNQSQDRVGLELRRDESSYSRGKQKSIEDSRGMENTRRFKTSSTRESRREKFNKLEKGASSDEDLSRTEFRGRKRNNENERFSISPSEPRRKSDKLEPLDLNYKLKVLRDSKKTRLTKVYCHACNITTRDWSNHKFSLKHIQNEKKARCLYCPKRIWFTKLKSHVQSVHKGCSFSCNVTSSCLVRLMDLGKLTDHINEKHRDKVDQVCHELGQSWQSWYVSSHHLAKSNLFLLPSDLRKLSCRLCGLMCLGQDQSALSQHFQLEHPDLSSSCYAASILFECRACDGMLFGSESYLLEHFRQAHAEAGLSINRESETEMPSNCHYKWRGETDRKRRYSNINQSFTDEESNKRREKSLEFHRKPLYSSSYKRRNNSAAVMGHEISSTSRRSVSSHGLDDVLNKREGEEESPRTPTRDCQVPVNERNRRYSQSCSSSFKLEQSMKKGEYFEAEKKPFYTYKKSYSEVLTKDARHNISKTKGHSSYGDDDSQSTEDFVETCPFCDKKTLQSRLLSHMKKKHKDNLFSCDGSCDKKFKSAWKSEAISHLKTVHNQKLNDSTLSRNHLGLPASLAMICCKVTDCYKAIFLARDVKQVEKMMTRHEEKLHGARDCFNLACRSCCIVFSVEEEVKWKEHLAEDHSLITNRPRTVSSSTWGVSEPGSDEDCSPVTNHGSDERSVRLVSASVSPMHDVDNAHVQETVKVDMTQCKFCGEMVEDEKEAEHELSLHLSKLFSCQTCQRKDERWYGQTAAELVSHADQEHNIDLKFKDVPAPVDQDTSLSICTVCQAQFYSRDPSMLATHLLDHDLGPDMGLFLLCCRICYSVRGEKDLVKDLDNHNEKVHFITTKKFGKIKVEEEPTKKQNKCPKVKTNRTEENSSINCQPCPYCGDIIDPDKIPFHVSTQHRKSTFRCTICVDSKMSTIATSSVTVFDKLDQAVDHMITVHQLDILKSKIAKAKATSSPTAVCPVLSCLSLHSPGLHLPASSHSLTQLHCAKCKATALKVGRLITSCDCNRSN